MGGLRKLKRGQDREYANAIAKIASRHGRKLSEVLLDFAKPLTAATRTEEDFRTAVEVAILSWNISFLPADERATFLRKSMGALLGGKDDLPFETEQCIQMLLDRKEALYSDDKRFVVEHELSGHGHDASLVVAYEITGT
jgi:hypothetical protein